MSDPVRPRFRLARSVALLAVVIVLIAVAATTLVTAGYTGLRPASGTAVAMAAAADRPSDDGAK